MRGWGVPLAGGAGISQAQSKGIRGAGGGMAGVRVGPGCGFLQQLCGPRASAGGPTRPRVAAVKAPSRRRAGPRDSLCPEEVAGCPERSPSRCRTGCPESEGLHVLGLHHRSPHTGGLEQQKHILPLLWRPESDVEAPLPLEAPA